MIRSKEILGELIGYEQINLLFGRYIGIYPRIISFPVAKSLIHDEVEEVEMVIR